MQNTPQETENMLTARVKDAIVSQALAPSTKVTELSIAKEFETTRTVAKSLIERLVAEKFLVSVSPRITRVAPLTILSIRENFLLRRLLMPELMAMSLPVLDASAIDTLYSDIDTIEIDPDNADDVLALLKRNRAHNLFTVSTVKYPTLVSWVEILEDIAMRVYWLYVREFGALPSPPTTQAKLVDAMRNGDRTKARQTVLDMLEQTEERVLSALFANDAYFSNDLLS